MITLPFEVLEEAVDEAVEEVLLEDEEVVEDVAVLMGCPAPPWPRM